MELFLKSKKGENKYYKTDIYMDPLPESCYKCPFFYLTNPDEGGGWYEHWTCFLGVLRTKRDYAGIALERSKKCPLKKGVKNEILS